MVDHFSRWFETAITPDQTASSTAAALLTHWISRFGAPHTILTDRGSPFISDLFRELNTLFGISRIYSSPYHPQGNGVSLLTSTSKKPSPSLPSLIGLHHTRSLEKHPHSSS
eukprot:GHVO01045134.1.p2 GENE.GHVO01045134.1~~GHVO01045134.1.p2  ORF type:complete len:112 (-),score=5.32 GHVO01045134.1:79-414(-)